MDTYSVWYICRDGIPVWQLARGEGRPVDLDGPPDQDCVRRLAVFEASSWDEAVQRFNRVVDAPVPEGG